MGITITAMTSRTYLESRQPMLSGSSTCAKQEWSVLGQNQHPTFADAIALGRPEAAL